MAFLLRLSIVLLALLPCAAEVVDRIVAVVNKQVILQSELEQTLHVEFLLQGKPLNKVTGPEQQTVLEQLIDRDLLEQQSMHPELLNPTAEELAAHMREVRAQLGATDNERWQALLASYGVTEQDVEEQVSSQIRIVKFVDRRFRALAQIDRTAINAYYQEKLLPQLRKQNASLPPLNEVAPKIEKILAEQRIDELLSSWLQTLRSQSHIQKMSVDRNVVAADDKPAGEKR